MRTSHLKVSAQNQKTINDYIQDLRIVENLKSSSLRNNSTFIRTLGDYLGKKSFKDATESDMKQFLSVTTYQGDSQEPLKVSVRKFYRWLYKTDDYPAVVKWMKLKTMKQRLEARDIDSMKKKIVSIEEYQVMLSHISNDIQMQAVLEALYYSGVRVGELVSMNICDVQLMDDFVLLSVRESKTKKRQIPIKPVPELLIRWIDCHPLKNDKDAPLFISFNRDRRVFHQRLSSFFIEKVFRDVTRDLNTRLSA